MTGKILYRYLFFSYSFLTTGSSVNMYGYTFPQTPLVLVFRGKNVQRVKRKSTETSLIMKLYVFRTETPCTSPTSNLYVSLNHH
jgi:hypothetical protein